MRDAALPGMRAAAAVFAGEAHASGILGNDGIVDLEVGVLVVRVERIVEPQRVAPQRGAGLTTPNRELGALQKHAAVSGATKATVSFGELGAGRHVASD